MEQPNLKDKKELLNLFKKEKVNILGTKKYVHIGYMKGYTLEKLSSMSLWVQENVSKIGNKVAKKKLKVAAKEVSYGVLNGMKIFFFHWIYWRYLYYIKGYTLNQLAPILEEIKKKVPQTDYARVIILASLTDITMMNLSEKEQKAIRAELLSDKEDKSEKSTNG